MRSIIGRGLVGMVALTAAVLVAGVASACEWSKARAEASSSTPLATPAPAAKTAVEAPMTPRPGPQSAQLPAK